MDPPTDDEESPSHRTDDDGDDDEQSEPELNLQRIAAAGNRSSSTTKTTTASAVPSYIAELPHRLGIGSSDDVGGGGGFTIGGGSGGVSTVSSLTAATTTTGSGADAFTAATDPRTIVAVACEEEDDAAAAADAYGVVSAQRVRPHPAANEAPSQRSRANHRSPQRVSNPLSSNVVLPRFKDQVGDAVTLQLTPDAVFPVGMLQQATTRTTTGRPSHAPSAASNHSSSSTTNDQRNYNNNNNNNGSSYAAAEEPCYSSSQYTGTTATTTTATTSPTNETSSAAHSDGETPYANVRVLTHSVLFGGSHLPQSHQPQPHQQYPVAAVTATPLPVPAIRDESILTTGYAQDQFAPRATRRPAFCTVTVFKPARDAVMGIQFGTDEMSGCAYISGFRDRGNDLSRALALSPLGVGDKVLTVNEIPCARLGNGLVAEMLRGLTGPVTITVENVSGDPALVETLVEKDAPGSTVGLNFAYTFADGGFVRVTKVSGLFANSLVQVGDRVVLVNGERPYSAAAAKDLIRSSPRFVSVTVESRTGVVLPVVAEDDETENAATAKNGRGNGKKVDRPATRATRPPPEAANCDCCVM